MGFNTEVYWFASTSIQTSTIADSSRFPTLNSSGLFLRAAYLQIARDSGTTDEKYLNKNKIRKSTSLVDAK